MNKEINQQLYPYLFPVEEKQVFIPAENKQLVPADKYNAIMRHDNNRLISIQKDTYQLIENSAIIYPLLEQLENMNTTYYFDQSHSYVTDARMSLTVLFPEINLFDGKSEIFFGLTLGNSYDSSVSVRIMKSCIRQICTNGMLIMTLLEAYTRKHTNGLVIDEIRENLEQTSKHLPQVSERISEMQATRPTRSLMKEVDQRLGKRIYKYVREQPRPQNVYKLLNYVTYYISHNIDPIYREDYMIQTSKLFNL